MPEPLDGNLDEIERWIEEGRLESSGRFTLSLSDARAKLAQFSQVDPNLWTLKIFQTFCLLGCSHLRVDQGEREWLFRGLQPRQPLDPKEVQLNFSEMVLTGELTPEQCLAWALVGLPDLAAARVVTEGEVVSIFGAAESELTAVADEVWLSLAYEKAPRFPAELWNARCWASTMSFNYEMGLWQRVQRLAVTDISLTADHWLEAYRICGSKPTLAPHSQGQALVEYGPPGPPRPSPRQNRPSCVFRHGTIDTPAGRDVMVFVTPGLAGASLVHPVQAGVLLQPMKLEGLPDGLKIYFAADGLGTDLSQFRLRQSPELTARLAQVLADLPALIEPLTRDWDRHSTTMVPVPSTSPVMDAAPGVLGAVGAFLALTPGIGWFVGGMCIAPSAFYFWYSRDSRKREHQAMLADWRARIAALHTDLLSLAERSPILS